MKYLQLVISKDFPDSDNLDDVIKPLETAGWTVSVEDDDDWYDDDVNWYDDEEAK